MLITVILPLVQSFAVTRTRIKKEKKKLSRPPSAKTLALKYDDAIFNVAIVTTSVIHTTSLFQTLFAAVISLRQLNSERITGWVGRGKRYFLLSNVTRLLSHSITSPRCHERRIHLEYLINNFP